VEYSVAVDVMECESESDIVNELLDEYK
jgi:hypothetical protein